MSSNKSYLEMLREQIASTKEAIKGTEEKLASSKEISPEEGEKMLRMLKEHLSLQEAEEQELRLS